MPTFQEFGSIYEYRARTLVVLGYGASYFGACTYFPRAKGYSWLFGLCWGLFYLVGLGVLLGLEDRARGP